MYLGPASETKNAHPASLCLHCKSHKGSGLVPECLSCYSSSQQWPRHLLHERNCQETYQQLHRSHSWLPCRFEDVKDWAVQPHQALLQTLSSSLPNLVTKIDHGMSQFQDMQLPMILYGLQANPSDVAVIYEACHCSNNLQVQLVTRSGGSFQVHNSKCVWVMNLLKKFKKNWRETRVVKVDIQMEWQPDSRCSQLTQLICHQHKRNVCKCTEANFFYLRTTNLHYVQRECPCLSIPHNF